MFEVNGMNEDFKAVGARIRAARKKLNLSQVDFSERLNISPSYISDIEMGKTKFGIDIFMRITETLQVSASIGFFVPTFGKSR